jgi:hypothetical protein
MVYAAERLLDRDLEASDDAGVAASREQLGLGIARRHPCIAVLGVATTSGKLPVLIARI